MPSLHTRAVKWFVLMCYLRAPITADLCGGGWWHPCPNTHTQKWKLSDNFLWCLGECSAPWAWFTKTEQWCLLHHIAIVRIAKLKKKKKKNQNMTFCRKRSRHRSSRGEKKFPDSELQVLTDTVQRYRGLQEWLLTVSEGLHFRWCFSVSRCTHLVGVRWHRFYKYCTEETLKHFSLALFFDNGTI